MKCRSETKPGVIVQYIYIDICLIFVTELFRILIHLQGSSVKYNLSGKCVRVIMRYSIYNFLTLIN